MADGFLNNSFEMASADVGGGGPYRRPAPRAFGGGETALSSVLRQPPAAPAPAAPQVGVDPKSAFTPPPSVPANPIATSPATGLAGGSSELGAVPDIGPVPDRVGPKLPGGFQDRSALGQVLSAPPTAGAETPVGDPRSVFSTAATTPDLGTQDLATRDGAVRGGTIQREAAAATPGAIDLPTLNPPDERFTGGLGYYSAYTNDGDFAGAVMVNPGRKVRLVDPGTGQVVAEGVGPEGAQQIVALANAVSKDLGRKAQWRIEGESDDGTFQAQAGERYDPKKPSLFKTLVRIAAPILGAAIPGLAPALGAALGGFGGTLATGGNLKQSLLAGAAGGIGNVAGGALSSVFQGAPIAWSGVNPLGGVLGHAGDALGGLTGGAGLGGAAGGSAAGAAGGAAGSLASAAPGAAAGLLGTEVAPVIVQAATQPGLATLGAGALGSALGAVGPSLAGGASLGEGVTQADWDAFGALGGDASSLAGMPIQGAWPVGAGVTTSAPPAGTEVEGITVTAPSGPAAGAPIVAPTAPTGGEGVTAGGSDAIATDPSGQVPDWLLDFAGQTIGGVGADLGVYGLAGALGLLGPGGGGRGGDKRDQPGADPGPGDQGDSQGPGPVDAGPGPTSGGPADSGAPPKPGTVTGSNPSGSSGAGVPGTPRAMTYSSSGRPSAPGAAAPRDGTRGSTAPDVYPWRRPEGR